MHYSLFNIYIATGLIDCSVQEKNPVRLRFALELYQSLQAKLWSTSPYVARQVEGIGPSHAKTLAQANLINMDQLRNCEPGRIEMVRIIINLYSHITYIDYCYYHRFYIEILPLVSR